MKKGILILIAGITILGFILVGFIGAVPTGIIPVVYIDSINIKDMFGNSPTLNESSGVKMINIDWYDRDSYQTVDYEGSTYIGYFFVTTYLHESPTKNYYEYRLPAESPYVTFNPESANAKHQGLILIKQAILTDSQIAGKRTTKKVDVTVQALDGGTQPTDTIRLVIDYARQPHSPGSSSSSGSSDSSI